MTNRLRESLPKLTLHVAGAFAKAMAAKGGYRVYQSLPRAPQRWMWRVIKTAMTLASVAKHFRPKP